jgi:lysophospholipase L1-like esterase
MLRAVTRKRIIIFIALLAVVSGWLWSRQPNHWKLVNLPPAASGPWVAFGDSLTEGYGASESSNYPALLGRDLGVLIRNFGASGHTTGDGLQRLDEVAALQPRVVLLCLGGNDSLNHLPREQMLANLRAIILRLQGEGSFVVLLGIRSASLRDHNESLFRSLARETGCYYIADLLRGIWGRPIYMSDAIHPNDQGYARIAERLAGELRPVLTKIDSVKGAQP